MGWAFADLDDAPRIGHSRLTGRAVPSVHRRGETLPGRCTKGGGLQPGTCFVIEGYIVDTGANS